jgi:TRAP-type mannitol/chloroaromatic compound transport system substrate-binding protein
MGATPVAMAITELYPQLERGVIDGAMVPFTTILDFSMYEVANYFTVSGPVFGRSQFTVVMNQASYDNLSPELQAVIDNTTGIEMSNAATQAYLDRADEAIEYARGMDGKEVIELSQEEQDRIAEVLRPIFDEWLAEMEAQGHRRARIAGGGRLRSRRVGLNARAHRDLVRTGTALPRLCGGRGAPRAYVPHRLRECSCAISTAAPSGAAMK